MALYQRAPYTTADPIKVLDNESDAEEEALVNDYNEQVQFDDGLDDGQGYGVGGSQDLQVWPFRSLFAPAVLPQSTNYMSRAYTYPRRSKYIGSFRKALKNGQY